MPDSPITSLWRPILQAAAVAAFGPHGWFALSALGVTSLWVGQKIGSENAKRIGEVASNLFTELSSHAAHERLLSLRDPKNHDIERGMAIAIKDSLQTAQRILPPVMGDRYDSWFALWDQHLKRALKTEEQTASLFHSDQSPDPVELANASQDKWWPVFEPVLLRWADAERKFGRHRAMVSLGVVEESQPEMLPDELSRHLATNLLGLTQQALLISLRERSNEKSWIAWQQHFLKAIAEQTRDSSASVADQLKTAAGRLRDLNELRPCLEAAFAEVRAEMVGIAAQLNRLQQQVGPKPLTTSFGELHSVINTLRAHLEKEIARIHSEIASFHTDVFADAGRLAANASAPGAYVSSGLAGVLNRIEAILFVTNERYQTFILATKREGPSAWSKTLPFFPDQRKPLPVSSISWEDAVAYCDFFGGTLPEAGTPLPDSSDLEQLPGLPSAEWIDAGDHIRKQFRDLRSGGIHLASSKDPAANVGFRCLSVEGPPIPEGIFLASGEFRLGTDAKLFGNISDAHGLNWEERRPILNRPAARVELSSFRMAKYCVTNQQYWSFVKQTGHRPWPRHWISELLRLHGAPFSPRQASWPVVNVTIEDAQAYCNWSGSRLPSGKEWERAASGSSNRLYPWGDEYDSSRCNSRKSGKGHAVAVNHYASGATPEGLLQMCGNIFEWTKGPDGGNEVRGGSWKSSCELWGVAFVFRKMPHRYFSDDIGFRTVSR